jgi:hypothetical protein
MENNSNSHGNAAAFAALGTFVFAIIGTSLAAPLAIGGGIGLTLWGIFNLKNN